MPTTINDELTRIEQAKAAIATAIGNKGVTVPANAKIDDYATMIDTIQTGGGSPNLQSKSVSITTNGTTNVVADSGYDGLSSVEVGVSVATREAELRGVIEGSVQSLVIPDGTQKIDNSKFANSALMSITIPNSVTSIGNSAFNKCSLSFIRIPNSVTSIGASAFASDSALSSVQSIALGTGITTLNTQTFYNTRLEKIVLPSNIQTIGANVFTLCRNMQTIVCLSSTPATIQSSSFGTSTVNCTGLNVSGAKKLYVPQGSKSDYENASNWSAVLLNPSIANFTVEEFKVDAVTGNILDLNDNIIAYADGTFPTT